MSQVRPYNAEAVNLAKLVAERPDLRRGVTNEGFDEAYPDPVDAMQFSIDFFYYYIAFSQKLKAMPSSRSELDLSKVKEALEFIANFCGHTLTITDAPQEYLDQLMGTKFNLRVNPNEPMDKWWFVDGNLKYLFKFSPARC